MRRIAVLDENSLDDIEHTLALHYVMKNGILYDDDTLATVWPTKQALPAWVYAGEVTP